MSKLIHIVFQLLLVVSALTFAVKSTKAQDPVKQDPNYKVVYENDEVRVLKFDDKPGDVVPLHSHPWYKVYISTPAMREFFPLDKKTGACSAVGVTKLLVPNNDPTLSPPVAHCEKNVGTTETHLVVVECKKASSPWCQYNDVKPQPSRLSHRKRR
jgi:hypothetical protein